MIRFVLIYASGDRRRTHRVTITATDIDDAAIRALGTVAMREVFGAGADWFLAGVVQEDVQSEVAATLEAS